MWSKTRHHYLPRKVEVQILHLFPPSLKITFQERSVVPFLVWTWFTSLDKTVGTTNLQNLRVT